MIFSQQEAFGKNKRTFSIYFSCLLEARFLLLFHSNFIKKTALPIKNTNYTRWAF